MVIPIIDKVSKLIKPALILRQNKAIITTIKVTAFGRINPVKSINISFIE